MLALLFGLHESHAQTWSRSVLHSHPEKSIAMSSSRRLAQLFHAISERDWSAVKSAAEGICVESDEKGHHSIAKMLRGSLTPNGVINGSARPDSSQLSNCATFAPNLTRLVSAPYRLEDVRLRTKQRTEISEVVAEWRHRDALVARGMAPRTKLFFHGPPGIGKTMTALAMGAELGMPVYLARFDAIIGSYLGLTAVHLRQLFHFAESTACILLLDELDALGKRRGNPLDVGELDRIVISLMQELEHAKPRGLIIATTNVATHIDAALWRRFDLNVLFPAPTKREIEDYSRKLAGDLGVRLSTSVRQRLLQCSSYSDARSELLTQARRDILKQCEDGNVKACN